MPAYPGDVDPDAPGTWPTRLRQLVERWHATVPARRSWEDFDLPGDAQEALTDALTGHRLRAYHCTRLLHHETQAVRDQGLRVFGRELFDGRVRAAAAHGAIRGRERVALLRGHIYGCGELCPAGTGKVGSGSSLAAASSTTTRTGFVPC